MGLASAPGAPMKGFSRRWYMKGGVLEVSRSGAMGLDFVFESEGIEPGTTSSIDTWGVSRGDSTGRSSAGGDANLVFIIGLDVL